jgi:type IV pilus assembly protein PilB
MKHNARPEVHTPPDAPRVHDIKPEDFGRCKDYLARQFTLSAEKRSILAKTPPAQLYATGATLGISSSAMAQAIAICVELPFLPQITPVEIRPEVFSMAFCRTHRVVPLRRATTPHAFALCNPFDFALLDLLRQHAGPQQALQLCITAPEVLAALLKHTDFTALATDQEGETLAQPNEKVYDLLASVDTAGEAEIDTQPEYEIINPQEAARSAALPPIVRLVNMLLTEAVKQGASDIHIEPQESRVQVRYRIDGVLIEKLTIPKHLHPPLVSRLKIISRLDISEHRRPQDGRSRLRFEGRHIDLRLSILPAQLGPKVVIRLLDSNVDLINMDHVSFTADCRQAFEQLLSHSAGMILVTGPTGSGKTTTLYAALNWLKSPTKNIVTVENPVEYQMPGVTQVHIDVKAGMTFAAGLRSILRQDPDIILVGEIRDQETASIAMEASQTGHLLLSTLHTNDAPTTITRLIDLGIEPFKITSSLLGILAQRLARRLCPACAEATAAPSPETLAQLGLQDALPANTRWQTARGCEACYQTGFKGRLALHELLELTPDIRELIHQHAPDHALRAMARQHGMLTLLEDGLHKAAMGLTTLDEVLRVAPRLEAPSTASVSAQAAAPGPVLASTPVTATPAVPATPATPAATGTHLLVIEDDTDTQTLLQRLLESQGYAVTVAGDGIEALMQLGRQRFDLLLSDIDMPNLNGLQLLETILRTLSAEEVR